MDNVNVINFVPTTSCIELRLPPMEFDAAGVLTNTRGPPSLLCSAAVCYSQSSTVRVPYFSVRKNTCVPFKK